MNKKEFDGIQKILEQKFASASLDGYIAIACGEALTKLWEKEKGSGHELPEQQRKRFIYITAKNAIIDEIRRQQWRIIPPIISHLLAAMSLYTATLQLGSVHLRVQMG